MLWLLRHLPPMSSCCRAAKTIRLRGFPHFHTTCPSTTHSPLQNRRYPSCTPNVMSLLEGQDALWLFSYYCTDFALVERLYSLDFVVILGHYTLAAISMAVVHGWWAFSRLARGDWLEVLHPHHVSLAFLFLFLFLETPWAPGTGSSGLFPAVQGDELRSTHAALGGHPTLGAFDANNSQRESGLLTCSS